MHDSTRIWWTPWKRRCACGRLWPHPAEPTGGPLPDGTDATYTVLRMGRPDWDGPTVTFRPLLTRGQAARTAGHERRPR